MNLLHAFILQQAPSTFVNTQHLWLPIEMGLSLNKHLWLVDPTYFRHNGLAYLLFDKGQDLYDDHILWNAFFKGVSDRGFDHYHIILFCSYGSPSSHPVVHNIGTPLVLHDAACISLWPREGSIGILSNVQALDFIGFTCVWAER